MTQFADLGPCLSIASPIRWPTWHTVICCSRYIDIISTVYGQKLHYHRLQC